MFILRTSDREVRLPRLLEGDQSLRVPLLPMRVEVDRSRRLGIVTIGPEVMGRR